MDPVIRCSHLCKSYGTRQVLADISFEIAAAERVALMGPSGSGKSTLLNCLGGIDRPDSGEVRIAGQTLAALDEAELSRLRRETVSTVFQFFHLLPTLTAAENIEFPLQLLKVPVVERAQRVDELLEEVHLLHRRNALPDQLSGGEMQRIAIARALAPRPKLILADEPTGNLDSVSGEAVLQLLKRLTERYQSALVLVTHSEEATWVCNRVLRLRDGALE
jgi:ABC-type lipoprotein export system ATPase subunit